MALYRLDGHTDPPNAWAALLEAKGDLAFDIGANIGQSAKVLAERFKQVVAWEPCRESFEVLQDEMPPNVLAVNEAVSDHEGEVVLDETERSIVSGQLCTPEIGLSVWGPVVGTRTVPCATLDTLVTEYGAPDFVKIDTEGHEVLVIEGGRKTFEAVGAPYLFVEVHKQGHEQAIRDLLPWYRFKKLVWEHGVRRDRPLFHNHFWLVGGPR